MGRCLECGNETRKDDIECPFCGSILFMNEEKFPEIDIEDKVIIEDEEEIEI